MDTLESMLSSYVDEAEVPTDCTVSEAAITEKIQFFDTLIEAETYTVNDPFLHELHCSIDSDLDDKVLHGCRFIFSPRPLVRKGNPDTFDIGICCPIQFDMIFLR